MAVVICRAGHDGCGWLPLYTPFGATIYLSRWGCSGRNPGLWSMHVALIRYICEGQLLFALAQRDVDLGWAARRFTQQAITRDGPNTAHGDW